MPDAAYGAPRGPRSWQLFAGAVLIWGTTWHAIVYQIDATPPEQGVAIRFSLAAALVLAVGAWRGDRWRFGAREHGLLALQGVFMYGLAYIAVYHAERHVASGLVAVGYSASPLVNGLGARWLWGAPLPRRFVFGGALGVAGVALIFWPEFGRLVDVGATRAAAAAAGLGFTVAAVLLSSVGSLAASRNRAAGLPFWPALGWGMAWGALFSWVVVLATGRSAALPMVASWWLALGWLAVAGSAVAFACYLALQERVGPGAAGSVGVATPVLALVVSALFEGYRPGWAAAAGLALAMAGNVLMLRPPRPAAAPPKLPDA